MKCQILRFLKVSHVQKYALLSQTQGRYLLIPFKIFATFTDELKLVAIKRNQHI